MRKYIIILASVLFQILTLHAMDFKDETLHYVVTYKWGLITKDSGDATIKLKNDGGYYDLILTGKTRPWADRFYEIRDTLTGRIDKAGFRPLNYVLTAHEKGKYKKDVVEYLYSGNNVEGKVQKIRSDKDGNLVKEEKLLKAQGRVFDMLSIFYYLRTVDYSRLLGGGQVTTTMFSGSKKEELTVRCVGKEKIKLEDKKEYEAYHIKFRFTSDGGKKSSEDIDTWVSTSPGRVPLLITGQLPVGHVRCLLSDPEQAVH